MAVSATGTSPERKTIRPRRGPPSVSAVIELARLPDGNLDTAVAGFRGLVGSLHQRIAFSVRSDFNGRGIETHLDEDSEQGGGAGHPEFEIRLGGAHRIGVTNDEHFRERATLDRLEDLWQQRPRLFGELVRLE